MNSLDECSRAAAAVAGLIYAHRAVACEEKSAAVAEANPLEAEDLWWEAHYSTFDAEVCLFGAS